MIIDDGFQPIRRQRKQENVRSTPITSDSNDFNIKSSDISKNFDSVLQPVKIEGLVEETMEIDNNLNNERDIIEFPQASMKDENNNMFQKNVINIRRIMVPSHRLSPLKKNWLSFVEPIVKHMKLLIRMNVKKKCVELKMTSKTPETSYLQKSADFLRSFMLGFDIQDGIALLRLNDLFLESFEIKDVKILHGDHLSRCIGRISGKEGKTKFAIENATRTRIVLADSHIHILGAYENIRAARNSICALILGSPAGKVYSKLRTVSKRLNERLQ